MLRPKILIIICFMNLSFLHGQTIRIDSIKFTGNKRTNTKYLNRFVSANSINDYDSTKVHETIRILRTLPGILDVDYSIESEASYNTLNLDVKERWTLFPTGDFKLTNDEKWFGFGLMDYNLFGRGIYFYFQHTTQSNWGDHIIIRHPYIWGKCIGLDLEFRNKMVKEEYATDYINIRTIDYHAAIKYELKFENDILFGFSRKLFSSELNNNEPQNLSIRSNGYFIESRNQKMDYKKIQQDGWKNKFKVHYRFLTDGRQNFVSFYNELKFFKSIYKVNFAGRFIGGFSNEEDYYFQPYYIDNTETIRGAGYRAERGNRILAANFECRYSFLETKYFGLQMVGFFDSAHLGLKTNNTIYRENVKYLGGGTRFIYVEGHNAMVSIDYSINLDPPFNKQFIISWGQYF